MGRALDTHLAYLLTQAERRVNRPLARLLRGAGLTLDEWRVLQALADGHGRSMAALAEAVLLNQPTLTKVVDRMASEALVYRRPHATDRRKVVVHLAAKGRTVLDRVSGLVAQHEETLAASYGEARTQRLMQDLSRLVDELEQSPVD